MPRDRFDAFVWQLPPIFTDTDIPIDISRIAATRRSIIATGDDSTTTGVDDAMKQLRQSSQVVQRVTLAAQA